MSEREAEFDSADSGMTKPKRTLAKLAERANKTTSQPRWPVLGNAGESLISNCDIAGDPDRRIVRRQVTEDVEDIFRISFQLGSDLFRCLSGPPAQSLFDASLKL